jgi:hypothetical protein
MRALFAVAFVTMSAVGMSCDVNDYCLNCAVDGDAGNGDGGDGDGGDGGDNGDATDGGQCIPSGTEVCDNKDNDCDGATDEGQLPTIGDLCDNQMGECAGGVKTCVVGVVKCTKPPMGEICDNKDNDCDGVVDDGDPGGGAKCGTDMGECKAGTLTCQAGSVQCLGAIGGTMAPFGVPESCDGKDNNCDGLIDNGAPVSPTFCDNNDDAGLCNKGTPTCIGGATICVGLVGPSPELCDNLDQDCDGDTNTTNPNTNGFFLDTDPTNCGACGNVCNLMNAVEGCASGQCTIAACEANYHNNNGQTGDGCEFGPCTKNGNEVCNNADDDCDGLTDAADADMVTPPVATMCRTAGECAGATVVCDGAAGGFRCEYPDPDVQETNGVIQQETLCDGLDNDCDGAVDEGQPNLTQTCTRGQGECQTTGTFICDTADLTGPAICNAAPPGVGATEVCDGKDNDCNGTIDDGALAGNLGGQEWVPLPIAGSTVEMMKYEASRPDATTTDGGTLTTHACSRPNAQPWTSLTYLQAVAVCNGMGARLCTETEWQSTCLPDVTYPVAAQALTANVDDFRFIEAENPQANVSQSGRTWTATSPSSFNGTTAMQVSDTGFAVLNSANAVAQAPRLDYTLDLAGATAYRVWMRMRSPPVSGTTPQLRNHTSAVAGLTANSDAATQVGDLVIVTTFSNQQNNVAAHNTNTAAGFVFINSFSIDDGNNDARLSMAYKVATVAGAQAYQGFTSTASNSLTGLTVLRAGTYDLATITSQTIANNSNSEPNPPSVGTVGASTLVLAIGAWNMNNSFANDAGAPSGFGELWDFGGTTTADLSVASAFGQGDPGPFTDGLNNSVDSTLSATIAISGSTVSRSVWVGLNGTVNATPVSTSTDDQWQWVVSPALTSGSAGTHTFSIYMREDGVMIDTIAFSRQATNTPTFDNAWAYETNPRTAQPQVCNGDEVDTAPAVAIAASPTGATAAGTTATFTTTAPHRLAVGSSVTVAGVGVAAYNGTWTVVTTPTATRFTATIGTSNPAASGGGTANGDQDDTLATGWSAACHAEHTTGDVFDMSGNVKEWTQARVFGQNPLRGGSSNNAVNGLTCKLNFTLADNEFFFPNVGFRCCRD